ncbi:MAG: hypothetical protein QW057_00465 [Candidatus Bathyarchaeia archaeon]
MRASVIAVIGILTILMVGTTIYLDNVLRGVSVTQIADVLARPAAFNNSIVELHGTLHPYGSLPSRYAVLRDASGALILAFPEEVPAEYLYSEAEVKGKVQFAPRLAPELWLCLDVTSYRVREVTLKVALHRTGGIAGADDLLVIEPDGRGRYTSRFTGEKTFALTVREVFQLRAIIVGNDFQTVMPETYGAKPDAADYFSYSLTVTYYREGREAANKTVSWVDPWALRQPLPKNLEQIRSGLEAFVAELVHGRPLTDEEAARLAVSAVRSSATFRFDGLDDSLEVTNVGKVVNMPPTPGYFWLVEVTYSTRHPGHGNRSGLILLQVITRHRAVVTLDESGTVTGATCDDVWDLLADEELASPPTRPTRFTVVEGERKLDVYVDVDVTDGVTGEEARLIVEATFTAMMGDTVIRRLDNLTRDGDLLKAHFTWGYSTEGLGHWFEATVDLNARNIVVTRCR